MERLEYEEFSTILQEMASMYRGVMFNEFFVSGYWRILKRYSLGAIRQAVLQLLGDEQRKDGMPTAAEIKSLARRYEHRTREATFIACQQHDCTELVPWPPKLEGEHTMFCGFHQSRHDQPATLANRIAVAATLTPKARAYLRSALAPVNPDLMGGIPITAEEATFSEPEDRYVLMGPARYPSDRQAAQMYGVTPEEVKTAQANASTRNVELL